jgi:hypothetical protein
VKVPTIAAAPILYTSSADVIFRERPTTERNSMKCMLGGEELLNDHSLLREQDIIVQSKQCRAVIYR